MVILMLFLKRCVKFYLSMVSYQVLFLSYLASCQYGTTPNIQILSMQSGVYNSVIITVLTMLFQSQSTGGLNNSSSSSDMASKVQSSTSDSPPASEGGGTVTCSSGEVSKLGYLQYS